MRGACRDQDLIHSHCGHHPVNATGVSVIIDGKVAARDGDIVSSHLIPPCDGPTHAPAAIAQAARCVYVDGIAILRQEDPVESCQPMRDGSSIVEIVD